MLLLLIIATSFTVIRDGSAPNVDRILELSDSLLLPTFFCENLFTLKDNNFFTVSPELSVLRVSLSTKSYSVPEFTVIHNNNTFLNPSKLPVFWKSYVFITVLLFTITTVIIIIAIVITTIFFLPLSLLLWSLLLSFQSTSCRLILVEITDDALTESVQLACIRNSNSWKTIILFKFKTALKKI